MKLNDLIDVLAYSEIGASKFFNKNPDDPEASYEIAPRQTRALLSNINTALIAICIKIPLYRGTLRLRLTEGVTKYYINSSHSIRNLPEDTDDTDYYIYDTDDDPYEDNLIAISDVTSETTGYPLALNKATSSANITTPQPSHIKVTDELLVDEEFIIIGYSMYLPRIPLETTDFEGYDLDVPDVLTGAISAHIANSLMLEPQGAEDTGIGLSHLERFDKLCDQYLQQGVANSETDVAPSTFTKLGWI